VACAFSPRGTYVSILATRTKEEREGGAVPRDLTVPLPPPPTAFVLLQTAQTI